MKVFVNPLVGSNADLANMVTAKLISHLVKHEISVVESVDDADAVLNLSGLIQTSTGEYGQMHVRLQAGVRLVSKDGAVLWADDVRSSRYAESASSSFAENVAKNLEKALAEKPHDK
ncbi:MAG: hypothetical protein WBF42_17890 [Terracidiphilus sp.]